MVPYIVHSRTLYGAITQEQLDVKQVLSVRKRRTGDVLAAPISPDADKPLLLCKVYSDASDRMNASEAVVGERRPGFGLGQRQGHMSWPRKFLPREDAGHLGDVGCVDSSHLLRIEPDACPRSLENPLLLHLVGVLLPPPHSQ